jgi:hypothetical protein
MGGPSGSQDQIGRCALSAPARLPPRHQPPLQGQVVALPLRDYLETRAAPYGGGRAVRGAPQLTSSGSSTPRTSNMLGAPASALKEGACHGVCPSSGKFGLP